MLRYLLTLSLFVFATSVAQAQDQAQTETKPNILIIWGDDVGMWNISAYHRGMMGGSTPNIDRIANEGMIFMDHYAQASCTAGRAAFITGQYPLRTGLATVGLPGAKQGLQEKDPTLATMLKAKGYATGQFGKNHLGDRDEHLPTNHGFDEFYGILYHLNAGEYPEQYDYPKDPAVQEKYKLTMRGIIHSKAMADGSQQIEDLGPFGKERQRTLDQDVLEQSKRFIRDTVRAGKPFFVWHNTTRMHYRTNLNDQYEGKSGYGIYADGMMEMDDDVGELLGLLDELGVADNTIVMFSTDNGAASNSWPDGGNQPFHGEKGVGGWEGGFRVPMLVKWKGHIPAGVSTGEFMTMEDWMPTIMSWVGEPNLKEELLKKKKIGKRSYKVHLDGYDQSDLLLSQGKSKRKEFYYFTETTFHGMRYGDWKLLFKRQDHWFRSPQLSLSSPIIINLKLDPFERFIEARGYDEWAENHSWILGAAGGKIAEFVASFKKFPPSQESMSVQVDDVAGMINSQSQSR
ncbi:arylsulfatase [Pseudomaricurvus sp. HS19]|uniref:arylsulfatase n=1 Tax=Pseudomaricurvus sp. HS19 TaxID=2692626 RepID=UPI001368EFFC|nr:arylsulfatase [Pseudomaricurvus sp. HS19]MYM61945.1 sulfatase-like hydrolase/transferase [Pseudomaricurvus sp. HS19]